MRRRQWERTSVLRQRRVTLEGLVEKVVGHFGIKTEDVKSGSKVPVIVKARAVVCEMGVSRLGLISVSIAKDLGIRPSAVSKSIGHGQQGLWHEDMEEHLLKSQ